MPSSYTLSHTTTAAEPTETPQSLNGDQGMQYELMLTEVPFRGEKNSTVMLPELMMIPKTSDKDIDRGKGDASATSIAPTPSSTEAKPSSAPRNNDIVAPSQTTQNPITSLSLSSTTTSTPTPLPVGTPSKLLEKNDVAPSSSSASPDLPGWVHSEGEGMYRIGSHGPTLSTGAIVGICAGAGIFALLVLALLLWWCCRCCSRKRRRGERQLQLEHAAVSTTEKKKGRLGRLFGHKRGGSSSSSSSKSSFGSSRSGGSSIFSRESVQTVDDEHTLNRREAVFGRHSKESDRRQHWHDEGLDPAMKTFASFYDSQGARELPSNYHTLLASRDPFQDQLTPTRAALLPYYKDGRLSTGLGLTPVDNETTVPPLPPAPGICPPVPARVAPVQKRAVIASPIEEEAIRFDETDTVAPLRTSSRKPLAGHDAARDTIASVYSMESAQENHDFGQGVIPPVPPMPAMRHYV